MSKSPPWWYLAILILLGAASIIALSGGRTVEAIIIGVLSVPAAVVVGTWIYETTQHHRP